MKTPEQIAEQIAALKAENAELRDAISDLMSWFPEKPSPPEWRIKGGDRGADEAVAAVRAILQEQDDAK